MRDEHENRAVDLKNVTITDDFWKTEQELVRTEVIPYQWEALNDRVPGAAPSFAMHNFRAAKALRMRAKEPGFTPPVFGKVPFEVLPEDPAHPDPSKFYGFLFQDTDFYKWIEAVAYSLTGHPDPELQKTADEAITLVSEAQAEDGYLDTYYILNGRNAEFSNLRDNHELYCFGHLTEAAVAYKQATGNAELLGVAERYAAYVSSKIGPEPEKKHGYPGHEIAEMALVRLYEETGNGKYLELSRYFIDERGKDPKYFALEGQPQHNYEKPNPIFSYYQAHKPVREQDEAMGHAVRAMYLYSGMADIARLTEDESLKEACRKLFRSVSRDKMYVTGGVGSTHIGEAFTFPYDLPNDTAYTESCAAIGLVFFARRMLEMEPKGVYADVMERALYNGVLSGIALDGKSFFYVNPLEVWPEASHRDAGKQHVQNVRQKWFGCACCPPNIARLLGSVGAYAFTENEDTLFTHLYMSSELVKNTGSQETKVKFEVDRSDPAKWTVRILLSGAAPGFTLALRIPGWCLGKYTLSGAEGGEVCGKDGYLYVKKDWQETEALTLSLSCPVRFIRSDTRVRENSGKIALTHGPLVYCLEEKDNGPDLNLVTIGRDTKPSEVLFDTCEIAGRAADVLLVPGLREKPVTDQGLYFDASDDRDGSAPVTLRMIPYFMWANRGENEMQVWIRQR